MPADSKSHRRNAVGMLFLISGIILVASGISYNEFLFKLFQTNSNLSHKVLITLRIAQVYLTLAGGFFILLSELTTRIAALKTFTDRDMVANITLFALILIVPLFMMELIFRPFAARGKSAIFRTDAELGWRLEPNSEDMYAGAMVKINGKGLVGPELEYAKPDNVIRILHLGDSIAFGYGIERHQDTYPYLIESILEAESKLEIETINAGVNGYSTWQEYYFLKNEGLKYDPDIVILSFCLNDVCEQFFMGNTGVWM